MKILFLTSRFPYPPHRGDKLKIYNLLRRLAVRHDITLLSFVTGGRDLTHVGEIEKLGIRVETVYLPPWRSLVNSFVALFGSRPLQVGYYESGKMRTKLAALLGSGDYDVVHVHLIRMAQYMRADGSQVRILDLTDAGSLYLERFFRITRNPVKKLLLGVEYRRVRRYEAVVSEFAAALVCSTVDRDFLLSRAGGANIEVLLNGIDLDYFTPGGESRADPHRIIYTGNLSYFPNSDGIVYFVRKIFPLVKKTNPDATLYIVGKDPPAQVTGLASSDIVVTGFVEDIRAEYLKSAVAIAPIRFGAGTLNKVLEPMALGIPVVATEVGSEGLGLDPGRHLIVAADEEAFAHGVDELLNNQRLRNDLAKSAMTAVRARHSWDVIARTLEEIYEQQTGSGAGR